jgi:tRNA-specific 2-thiouridylase
MRVLVAMSGGVDSSVAAALLVEAGHEVVGATLKLWGGAQDSGCCSVGDVDDARRVAQQLGIAHHVFNFTDEFERHVVSPYVAAHVEGLTPNPCIECNRHLKFDRLAGRAAQLGFDALATGHHARVVRSTTGHKLMRGADAAKDQSYVLYMLDQARLASTLLPVGALTKAAVRAHAARLGLRTAGKPESQDTCFVTAEGGRRAFLGTRIPLRPGLVVDTGGSAVGTVPAVELVTVGQRRGLGGGAAGRRYAVAVEPSRGRVVVGDRAALLTGAVRLCRPTWVCGRPPEPGAPVEVQASAHGRPVAGVWAGDEVRFLVPERRPAPGQAVVLYDGEEVLGGGAAA